MLRKTRNKQEFSEFSKAWEKWFVNKKFFLDFPRIFPEMGDGNNSIVETELFTFFISDFSYN
jgi:hypothetical protein